MDYMTLREASEKWGVTPKADQLSVCQWAYPRRCEDGWCLADPKTAEKPVDGRTKQGKVQKA